MTEAVRMLRASPFFSDWTKPSLERLYWILERRRLQPGENVVTQGDVADFCFIIRSGKCDVLIADPKKPNEGARKVVSLAAGALVGEIALLKKGTKRD